MYQYTGPSLAAGGRLVKKGRAKAPAKAPVDTRRHLPDPAVQRFSPEQWAVMLAPDWDERGWHGGGMCKVRKTQKTRPSKGNTRTGRRAHPNILKP